MNSIDVLKEILLSTPHISTMRFFSFTTSTKLQDRLSQISESEISIITRVMAKKKTEGIRFWNAMLALFIEDGECNKKLLSEILYHQANQEYKYVSSSNLNEFLSDLGDGILALNSKVLMSDGSTRHIPLLDFKVASAPKNHQLASACIELLGLHGYLLDSGKSYHFIGYELVSESELLDILAKFILLDPVSDKAWAAHQIIERSTSLRITKKNGKYPIVVGKI